MREDTNKRWAEVSMRLQTTHYLSAHSGKLLTRSGFTLLELLVVISIIGTLASISTLNYSSVRMKARDAVRVANLKQLELAFNLYYDDHGGFPAGVNVVFGSPGAKCLDRDHGFASSCQPPIFASVLPSDPMSNQAIFNQTYTAMNTDGSPCTAAACPSYRIRFLLESGTPDLRSGDHVMTPQGMQ